MRSKSRLNRIHYMMASMLRFLAVGPIFSQAENIQDRKQYLLLLSPQQNNIYNKSKGDGMRVFKITKQQKT